MKKKSLLLFRLLLSLCFFSTFLGDPVFAQDKSKKDSYTTDFMTDALFTDPIHLTREGTTEQQLELIIVRWGNNDSDATFTLSAKQHPSFMTSPKWINGNEIHFSPGEIQKTATLSFTVQSVEKDRKEDLVLWVESTDPSLVPARRTIVLPFRGPVTQKEEESVMAAFLATVCLDSEKTDSPCVKDTPIYAGEPYTVQVKSVNDENMAFQFRITGPDQKELKSHTHYKKAETPLINIFEARAGLHAIEVRTTMKQDAPGLDLLGADIGPPKFEGDWQPVSTFEVLAPVIHFKGFVVEPFAVLNSKINLEMAPSDTKFSDPGVDITVTGSWNRKNCADKQKTILEKSSSQIRIAFPGKIDLIQSFLEPGDKTGIPFDLPVEIISRTAGKSQFKYCEDIDEAAFDVSFPGFYTPKKDPAAFMAGYTRSPGVFSFSENLFFEHPNPLETFFSTDPIPYYVRGPNADLTLKVNIRLEKKSFGNAIRSGKFFIMPVAFNLAMWKEPKDKGSRFVGEPLMGYAIYGAEPGDYTGPVPVALGTPRNREEQTPGSDSEAKTFSDTVEDLSPPSGKALAVPDLIGKSAKDAKQVLIDQGFEVELLAGKAAPTPEKAFTVAKITPGPDDVSSTKQKTVKMTVFVDYAPRIKIPVISGLTAGEAKKQLQDAGFNVTLKTRGNAPEPDKAFKTIGTEPGSGEEAVKGDTITLISFGPFQDQVTMPSLVGFKLNAAERELDQLGLEAHTLSAGPAPNKEQEDVITSQEPASGEMVSPRSRIVLNYYADYIWSGPMPDLAGLRIDQAREKIKETGIVLMQQFGIPAPSSLEAGVIYKQSPAANTRIKRGDYAEVVFYGKTKAQQIEDLDCSGLPGTESYWNETEGKTGCRCKTGYQIRKDKSGCDKKAESILPPTVVQPEKIIPPPVKKPPAPAKGLPQVTVEGDSTGTRLVLEKVIYSKYQAPEDLCKADQNCRHTSRVASGVLLDDYFFNDNGRAVYQFKETYQSTGDVLSDYNVEFFYNIPPSEIHAGDTLVLNISGTARGDTNKGWHIGRRFTYYIKQPGNHYFDKTDVYFNLRDLPKDGQRYRGSLSKQTVTRIPIPKRVKDTLVIGGRNGQDPALYVDWVYRVVPDSQGTGGSKPAAGKNTSSCDLYAGRLNGYMMEQQKISSRMMSDPGNSNSYACDLLKINREIIELAKEARANGCRIDGNLEAASKQLINTYQQMCK